MPTKLLVSKVDKTLDIAKSRTNFPNTERLVLNFKAGEPLEVPDYVADAYSKSYPGVYSIVDSKEKVKTPPPADPPAGGKTPAPFDAEEYLLENFNASQDDLKELDRSELFAIAKVLNLTAAQNIVTDNLVNKIAQELKIRNETSTPKK
jgi:hypothetical protein